MAMPGLSVPVAVALASLVLLPLSPADAVDPVTDAVTLRATADDRVAAAIEEARAFAVTASRSPSLAALLDAAVMRTPGGAGALVGAWLDPSPAIPTVGRVRDEIAASGVPPALVASLASLLAAIDLAEEWRRHAFAGLSDADAAALKATATRLASPETGRNLQAAALPEDARTALSKIDHRALAIGARALLAAVDAELPRLRALAQASEWPPARADASGDSPDACAMGGVPPVVIPGLLVLGSLGSDCFTSDALLVVDPGGDDLWINGAGGVGPSVAGTPVRVAIDLAGDDRYHGAPGAVGAAQSESFVQGAAAAGYGVLVDVRGNDRYSSYMNLDSSPAGCASGATAAGFTAAFVQGASFGGVGVLADLRGADAYNSFNALHQCASFPPDVLELSVAASQGAAVGGYGVLFDGGLADAASAPGGHDAYNSFNALLSENQPWASSFVPANELRVTRSQGHGATEESLGLFVDVAGGEAYNSWNTLDLESSSATSTLVVEASQGSENGVMIDGSGDDAYNCRNAVEGSFTDQVLPALAYLDVQGAGVALPRGSLVDLAGADCYNSRNSISGCVPTFRVYRAQGASGGGGGLMVEVAGDDVYNSENEIKGEDGHLLIHGVQGAVDTMWGLGGSGGRGGAFADLGSDAGDVYNSGNGPAMPLISLTAIIWNAQGGSTAATGPGDFRDLDESSSDVYNSFNAPGLTGSLSLQGVQGSGGFEFWFGGFVIVFPGSATFVEEGGGNVYNSFNAFPSGQFGRSLAFAATGSSFGSFDDRSRDGAPDTYSVGNGFPTWAVPCAGPGGHDFHDRDDGPDVPYADPCVNDD